MCQTMSTRTREEATAALAKIYGGFRGTPKIKIKTVTVSNASPLHVRAQYLGSLKY
jgi:hypothetical protein